MHGTDTARTAGLCTQVWQESSSEWRVGMHASHPALFLCPLITLAPPSRDLSRSRAKLRRGGDRRVRRTGEDAPGGLRRRRGDAAARKLLQAALEARPEGGLGLEPARWEAAGARHP
eukprot:3933357-Rhodomonas_salina.1